MKTSGNIWLIALVGCITGASLVALADFRLAENGDYGSGKARDADYKGVMKKIPHLTITFPDGSAALSDRDRTKLQDLVTDAAANGKISKFSVAAWSDKPF